MAGTSELIDFRRAFVWLLCGMLLPSVALVAFGVVAVVNERVAVERRLETEYGAKLRVLNADLQVRLRAGATAAAAQALAAAGSASADGRIPHEAASDALVLGLTPVRPSPLITLSVLAAFVPFQSRAGTPASTEPPVSIEQDHPIGCALRETAEPVFQQALTPLQFAGIQCCLQVSARRHGQGQQMAIECAAEPGDADRAAHRVVRRIANDRGGARP